MQYCVCAVHTQIVGNVFHVRFDDGRMKVFVVSEQLQISGVVFKIHLRERAESSVPTLSERGLCPSRPPLTLSFSELSSSCLISFSLASLTACFVTARMASCQTNRVGELTRRHRSFCSLTGSDEDSPCTCTGSLRSPPS